MTDAEVTINDQTEGASTANVDTKSMVGAGGKTVHRQVVTLGDNVTFGNTADVNANSELLVKHTDAIPVTDNAGSLTVDGTVAVSGSVAVTNANLDAGLSTLATQATLALIKAKTDNLDVALSSLEISEVTNAGTFAVQDSEKLADNAGFTDGTTKVLPIGFIYDEVAGTALTENDIAVARINVNRAAVNTLEDGVTRGRYATVTAANALKVDNSSVTQPVSGTVTINAIPTGTNNIGDVDIVSGTVTTVSTVTNVSQNGGVAISLNTGVRDTGTRRVTIATDDVVPVVGTVAHDTGDSGNPVKMGGRARTSNITSVTNDDRVDAIFDKNGRQVIVAGCPRELRDSAVNAAAITTTTETTIIAAVASEFHDIESIIISNSSAVATLIQIRDTTGGTVLMNIYSPANSTVGASIPNGLPQTTANTNWTAQAITTASSLFVTMTYVKNV